MMRKILGLCTTIGLMWMPIQTQAAEQFMLKTSTAAPTPKAARGFRDCPGCPVMVSIPSGRFDMGSPDSEDSRGDDEGPVHEVKISAFAMGKHEITRGQFAEFVKKSKYSTADKCWTLEDGNYEERIGDWRKPAFEQNDNHPVVCINWNDAHAYVKWLSRRTGKKYRLPSEAEWEYAVRGNTSTPRYWGVNPDDACNYANGADETAKARIKGATSWSVHSCADGFAYTAPVGSFKANSFGLHDMLGNTWEWTADNYQKSYQVIPADERAGQGNEKLRVLRGGSWNNSPADLRAAIRIGSKPELRFSSFGFRVARSIK